MRTDGAVRRLTSFLISLIIVLVGCRGKETASKPQPTVNPAKADVTIDWQQVVAISKTRPSLQVVVEPRLRRGTKVHDQAWNALHDLGCDYVRYVPWLRYPKLGVAELEPPKDGRTSWDFSLIDPMMEDFMNATAGHPVVINFSVIPQWMFKTPKPVPYPEDPDENTREYQKGTELRDPSLKEVADYYARLVSWYYEGGFTDEYGKRHESGHHYKIDYWEVLNEVESDAEHHMTPETYTRVYDAIVAAIRKVEPQMKFVGLAVANSCRVPEHFEYFLNPKNHAPGTPLDMLSYHFYCHPGSDETPEVKQFTFFEKADKFLDCVRYIESIRQRLSPNTKVFINEIGSHDKEIGQSAQEYSSVPQAYWSLSSALYAYIYAGLTVRGIDIAGESQLVGWVIRGPGISMVDMNTGQPNTRYWVLKLIHDNMGLGDKMVKTNVRIQDVSPYVLGQAFVTPQGRRKLLLVNKRDRAFDVSIPNAQGAEVTYVDQSTGSHPPASVHLGEKSLTLSGFEVAIVNLTK